MDTDRQLRALDALDTAVPARIGVAQRIWSTVWPVLGALALAVGLWELVVLSGWKDPWVLPGPGEVLPRLWHDLGDPRFWSGLGLTMRRAVAGFGLAVGIGVAAAVLATRPRPLRIALSTLITGLQTMPSIAWFPLAILLFQLSEQAILFVVVLGAAPSVASGLISGIDHTPPALLRAARVLGVRGFGWYRYVLLPAALPAFVTGLKQGWAFAWRSLMAGELLVVIGHSPSLGVRLEFARQLSDSTEILATMIVIMLIGIVVDGLFTLADHVVRARRGLTG
ncbi:ABC transporter permease [Nocardia stercoris]|uniref:ABC transporter permease n=1 Tax=Nocardia stercoris TaxID=2483361 RepID=A0A3M2L2N6_9NOCA|nr:ABC transporter permease [Nocardia stercoris]RMI31216.1 ABC transporter permease [Nocardia stercoris]